MAKVKIAVRGRSETENTIGKGPGHVLKLQAGLNQTRPRKPWQGALSQIAVNRTAR